MGRRFKIHDYIVDPNRNEISHKEQLTSVHKKAMSVLEVLAQANGKVVNSEDIMNKVWPESIVAPNSLQRCILQIRKALNDSGKSQSIIKTHPKLGYSINTPITWLEDEAASSPLPETKESKPRFWKFPTITGVLAVALFIFASITLGLFQRPTPHLEFSQVRPLTASDEKEISPIYSPDGRLVVFHRYGKEQEHYLWALDLETSQEYQLTRIAKRYGTIGWSPTGNQLTFAVHGVNTAAPGMERCWELHTLDLYAALQSPIDSVVRTPCKTEELRIARWVDSNKLSFILNVPLTERNALFTFDMANNTFSELFTSEAGRIYSYDYSSATQTFALVSRTQDNEHYIESIGLTGELQSKALIKRNQSNSKHEYYNLTYHPDGKQLHTHTDEGIHSVSLTGELQKVNPLTHLKLSHPYFHHTQSMMLAVQSRMDQDVALIPLNSQLTKPSFKTMARSNELDANAKFQPGTDNIAFISNRSGVNQLWLKTSDKLLPITETNTDVQHIDFAWSPEGKHIAAVMSDSLQLLQIRNRESPPELKKVTMKKIKTPFSVYSVMQWTSQDSLLVMAKENNQSAIFSIANIHSDSPDFQRLDVPEFDARWAAVHIASGQQSLPVQAVKLIYLNEDDELWVFDQLTQVSNKILNHDTSKTLTYHEGKIFGIDDRQRLWRYDADDQEMSIVRTVAGNVRYVSDIRGDQALVTLTHAHNMEIVEFQ